LLRLLPVIVAMATGYLPVRIGVASHTDGELVFIWSSTSACRR
jgi:hypothetical protein